MVLRPALLSGIVLGLLLVSSPALAASKSSAPRKVTSSSSASLKKAAPACTIKGNISTNAKKEKIYHLPNCASYKATVIETTKGEKWFCTEAEAKKAGWRKALNCK